MTILAAIEDLASELRSGVANALELVAEDHGLSPVFLRNRFEKANGPIDTFAARATAAAAAMAEQNLAAERKMQRAELDAKIRAHNERRAILTPNELAATINAANELGSKWTLRSTAKRRTRTSHDMDRLLMRLARGLFA